MVDYVLGDGDLAVSSDILEVLVTEEENPPLSSEESELVETLLGELRELHTVDLGTEIWAEVTELHVGSEEVGFGGVRCRIGLFLGMGLG